MNNKTLQRIQSILQQEQAVCTLQCPEPETLWEWQELGDQHPQAATLFDHLFVCAFCRAEYQTQWEIRVLTDRVPVQKPALPDEIRHLPVRIKNWVGQLLEDGIVTPLRSTQKALNRIDRLIAIHTPALQRSDTSLFNLQPSGTAVRSPRPTLRWSARYPAQGYEIEIRRIQPNNQSQRVLKQSVSARMEWTLPEPDRLEPGASYLWHVRTRSASSTIEEVSDEAGFTVLSQQVRARLEELEQKLGDSSLAHIGVCEAYGLYEEALQRVDAWLALQPEDDIALGLKTMLLHRTPS